MKRLSFNVISNLKNSSFQKSSLVVNKSNVYSNKILRVLRKFGYILSFKTYRNKNNVLMTEVFIKYSSNGKTSIKSVFFLTKPAKSLWVSYNELLKAQSILEHGVLFVENNFGIIPHKESIAKKIGGRLLFVVL